MSDFDAELRSMLDEMAHEHEARRTAAEDSHQRAKDLLDERMQRLRDVAWPVLEAAERVLAERGEQVHVTESGGGFSLILESKRPGSPHHLYVQVHDDEARLAGSGQPDRRIALSELSDDDVKAYVRSWIRDGLGGSQPG
jgi:hypothetical protein